MEILVFEIFLPFRWISIELEFEFHWICNNFCVIFHFLSLINSTSSPDSNIIKAINWQKFLARENKKRYNRAKQTLKGFLKAIIAREPDRAIVWIIFLSNYHLGPSKPRRPNRESKLPAGKGAGTATGPPRVSPNTNKITVNHHIFAPLG